MSNIAANKQVVREFFAAWGPSFDSMMDGFRKHLAPDCVLKMTQTPTLNGLAEIEAYMDKVRAAGIIETMEVEVMRLVAEDECVTAERMDYCRNAAGALIATFPTYSLMDFRNGKIVEWHDYFDSADLPTGGLDVVSQGLNETG